MAARPLAPRRAACSPTSATRGTSGRSFSKRCSEGSWAALPARSVRPATEEMLTVSGAAVAELVEEQLGRGHGAERVDLDHAAGLFTLCAAERAEENHTAF
jgi:hypothetical protein